MSIATGPWIILCLAVVGLFGFRPAAHAATAEADAEGFVPIFDGRSFEGWKAPDMSWWTIEDGAITGRITKERPCGTNQYLVFQGGELADFELRLKSRLRGEGGINNGFQFRSRVLPDGDVAGYQMDNNLQTDWRVRLYDEFGRHTLAWRGKQTTFDPDGRASTTDLPEGAGPAWFELEEWHEYHLVCVGSRISLSVDGRLAARIDDRDRRRADPRGVLALQLHSGPPTRVQFKDIRLKILSPATPSPDRPSRAETRRRRLLDSALAYWDLGVGGHMLRHPLRYVGSLDDFEFNVRAEGPGARPDARVTVLRAGWYDAGREPAVTNDALTVWIRARDPAGRWEGALIAKHGGPANLNFRLHGAAGQLRFEVRTESGTAAVDFPVAGLVPGAWHDFVGRYDGRRLELIRDGVARQGRDWAGGRLLTNDEPLLIGAETEGGKTVHSFRGELEGAAVWDRALSARELDRLVTP